MFRLFSDENTKFMLGKAKDNWMKTDSITTELYVDEIQYTIVKYATTSGYRRNISIYLQGKKSKECAWERNGIDECGNVKKSRHRVGRKVMNTPALDEIKTNREMRIENKIV